MLPEAEKEKLRKQMQTNQHEVYLLSLEEMDCVIKNKVKSAVKKNDWQELRSKVETSASYYASGKDVLLMNKLLADMGYGSARAYIRFYGGKPHIVLKGYPGLRSILTGTRYGVQNAKVVRMGLGKYGGVNAAKSGGVLTIILVTAYRVVDYFLRDDATLAQLFGSLATDIVKVGVATGVSIAAATMTAAAGTMMVSSGSATAALLGSFVIAIGPLAAAIVIGVGVSYALTKLDEKYGVTDKVIAALDEISEKGIQGIVRERKQALVRKGEELVSDAADSVIDYAIEAVQKVVIRSIHNLLRKMPLPSL